MIEKVEAAWERLPATNRFEVRPIATLVEENEAVETCALPDTMTIELG